MKVDGDPDHPTFWERFSRLQKQSHLLLGRGVCPKGVFRFKTFEEFNDWKERCRQEEFPEADRAKS
jgi:hypothetical protein